MTPDEEILALEEMASMLTLADRNNRYSMPVTSKRESVPETSAVSNMGMGPLNTTSFLFDDDEKQLRQRESATSPDVNTYLQMNTNDDKFPILVRNNQKPGVVSRRIALGGSDRLT